MLTALFDRDQIGLHRIFVRMDDMLHTNDNNTDSEQKLRIIQELVPGRQITLAHIIANPRPVLYQKLGLNPDIDYRGAAIGILTMTPSEMAIIGSDIATKSSSAELGFVDRFSGTLILTGDISSIESSLKAILDYSKSTLGFSVCPITRT